MMHLSSKTITACCLLLALHANAEDAQSEFEQYTARYQSTYNWQWHPSFSDGIGSSSKSISPTSERMYTFSATAHWGLRAWEGAELYINPEIASGIPFSRDLVGLGSFTNGEITRAAGSDPKLYLQRLFLRQTWNRGGDKEIIEPGFNQLGGMADKNRFVLTVGNFSTLDVFDGNAYAKDPRTQFMNWGSWTYSAYDYAADARGFGWGFATEWYQDDWAFRFGRMTPPKIPNGLPIDFAFFKHYGDQAEVEKSYALNGQKGTVRVLGWRNRGVLARFDDARAALTSSGQETILNVRNREQIKYGLGLNIEQALSDEVGVFLRLMKADGQTETQAFTEVDESLATGMLLNGRAWQRPEDSAGFALMVNGLSKARRSYLEAGGLSYFIGDGYLHYRPETIFETFYSHQVAKYIWLSGDYQHIQNPAYNAARGAIDVVAIRLHAEY
jgi:carbohydrate-selective porin OprB